MHARGIVHRDIKPANVLVGDTGIKLCDLGLAMYLTSEPTPYKKAGTPCYKAPEVLMGKPDYDARVDTWSLGCVMAEMLTGEKIFDGADDNDIDQLWTIFGVLGLPDDATWPGFSALPLANVTMRWLYERKKRSRLGELFNDQRLSQDGFEVLEGLLACNPDRRLTAAAALELPWFASFGAAAAAAELVALALPGENTIPAQTTPKKKNMLRLKVPLEIWNALRTATRSKTHGSGTYKRLSNL
jgi:cell division cycle 2-like protein